MISGKCRHTGFTNKICGIDHEKSKYSYVLGTKSIMGFTTVAYKSSCLGNLNIARDEEYLSNLLISEELFASLRKFAGLGLYLPCEMKW